MLLNFLKIIKSPEWRRRVAPPMLLGSRNKTESCPAFLSGIYLFHCPKYMSICICFLDQIYLLSCPKYICFIVQNIFRANTDNNSDWTTIKQYVKLPFLWTHFKIQIVQFLVCTGLIFHQMKCNTHVKGWLSLLVMFYNFDFSSSYHGHCLLQTCLCWGQCWLWHSLLQ